MKKEEKLFMFCFVFMSIFPVVIIALLAFGHQRGLIDVENNPLFFVIPLVILFMAVIHVLKFFASEVLPQKYGDLRKTILEKPLKTAKLSGKTDSLARWLFKVECFSKFFVVSSLGYCDKFSYSSVVLEESFFRGYVLKTKTSSENEIKIFMDKDLYALFKSKKGTGLTGRRTPKNKIARKE